MGRKGVSKRKPKKSGPFSGVESSGSSKGRTGEHSIVQSLVKDKGTPFSRDGMNPLAGSNKSQKKH
jgi:hypothetical protein